MLYGRILLLTWLCAHWLCRVWLFEIPWTVARQVPLSMGFSGQEYWRGLPCLPPEDLCNPGIKPMSPAFQVDSLSWSHQGSLSCLLYASLYLLSPQSAWFSQISRKRMDSVGNDMAWALRMLCYRCLWASGEVRCRPSDTWLWRAGWGPGWETTHTHTLLSSRVLGFWSLNEHLFLSKPPLPSKWESKGLDQPLPNLVSDPYTFPPTLWPRAPLRISLILHN